MHDGAIDGDDWPRVKPVHRCKVGTDWQGMRSADENNGMGRKGIFMKNSLFFAAVVAVTACAAPMMVSAQTEKTAELSGTALLNKQQQEKAARDNAEYAARVAAAERSVASGEEVFQARTDAYEAEKARVADNAATERLQWEADVKACEDGDKSRCAAPAMPE